jgi:hypothetical protein
MARRVCTTVPGQLSVCCQAAQAGLLGRPVTFTTRSGATRCGVCSTRPSMSTNPKKRGMTVFQFRFTANRNCGITSGCPYLPGAAGAQGGLPMMQQGGGGGTIFLPTMGTAGVPMLP